MSEGLEIDDVAPMSHFPLRPLEKKYYFSATAFAKRIWDAPYVKRGTSLAVSFDYGWPGNNTRF